MCENQYRGAQDSEAIAGITSGNANRSLLERLELDRQIGCGSPFSNASEEMFVPEGQPGSTERSNTSTLGCKSRGGGSSVLQ